MRFDIFHSAAVRFAIFFPFINAVGPCAASFCARIHLIQHNRSAATMELSDLNDDLIIAIADALPAGSVIAFALCNKQFHTLSYQRLKKHKEHQQRYSRLYVNSHPTPCNEGWTCGSALKALSQISRNPDRAFHVRRLEYHSPDVYGLGEEELEANGLVHEMERDFREKVADCHLLFDRHGLEAFLNAIFLDFVGADAGDKACNAAGYCFGLLLSQLPNLEILEISDPSLCSLSLDGLIGYITSNRDNGPPPLSNLRTLFIESMDSVSLILRFLEISPVRQLYLADVTEVDPGPSLRMLDSCGSTNLRIIGLADSDLTPEVLQGLVRRSPHLQSLTIAWDEQSWFPCGCDVINADESGILRHSIGGLDQLDQLLGSRGYDKHYIDDDEDNYGQRIIKIDVKRKV